MPKQDTSSENRVIEFEGVRFFAWKLTKGVYAISSSHEGKCVGLIRDRGDDWYGQFNPIGDEHYSTCTDSLQNAIMELHPSAKQIRYVREHGAEQSKGYAERLRAEIRKALDQHVAKPAVEKRKEKRPQHSTWYDDDLTLPRFIVALSDAGAITERVQQDVAKLLKCSTSEVEDLIGRAMRKWNELKHHVPDA